MSEWKDILFNNEKQISKEDLLKYLREEIPEENNYPMEKKLTENSFESDAIEGLKLINNEKQLQVHVQQLNKKLRQQLLQKKRRKEKRKVKEFHWILLAILILLFICIIGYIAIL